MPGAELVWQPPAATGRMTSDTHSVREPTCDAPSDLPEPIDLFEVPDISAITKLRKPYKLN